MYFLLFNLKSDKNVMIILWLIIWLGVLSVLIANSSVTLLLPKIWTMQRMELSSLA